MRIKDFFVVTLGFFLSWHQVSFGGKNGETFFFPSKTKWGINDFMVCRLLPKRFNLSTPKEPNLKTFKILLRPRAEWKIKKDVKNNYQHFSSSPKWMRMCSFSNPIYSSSIYSTKLFFYTYTTVCWQMHIWIGAWQLMHNCCYIVNRTLKPEGSFSESETTRGIIWKWGEKLTMKIFQSFRFFAHTTQITYFSSNDPTRQTSIKRLQSL